MGRMKDLLMEFVAVIYPDNYDKQDRLFECMMHPSSADPILNVTIEKYREFYERHNECAPIALEDMARLVNEFHQSAQEQTAPAMTIRKVAAALGLNKNPA